MIVTFYGSDFLRLENMVQDYFILVQYLINTPVPYDTPVQGSRKRTPSNHSFSGPALRRSGRRKTATATRNYRRRKAA